MTIEFFIPGTPKGEPRPRARAFYDRMLRRPIAQIYPDDSADDWKALVAVYAKRHRPAAPFDGPIRVDLKLIFPRPRSHYGTGRNAGVIKAGAPELHTAKPDRDNCDKLILDQLTGLGFWRDDALVCSGSIEKIYQGATLQPGALVRIEYLNPPTLFED